MRFSPLPGKAERARPFRGPSFSLQLLRAESVRSGSENRHRPNELDAAAKVGSCGKSSAPPPHVARPVTPYARGQATHRRRDLRSPRARSRCERGRIWQLCHSKTRGPRRPSPCTACDVLSPPASNTHRLRPTSTRAAQDALLGRAARALEGCKRRSLRMGLPSWCAREIHPTRRPRWRVRPDDRSSAVGTRSRTQDRALESPSACGSSGNTIEPATS
jgi:hypothetical protein